MRLIHSYYSIIKEASLFSSVQIILLLVSMIKGKFIAEYLGVEAIGLLGILQTAIGFFIALFSLGLPMLLVRQSALSVDDDFGLTQKVIKRLIIGLSVLGCCSFYLFTPLFSDFFLQNKDYGWLLKLIAFVIIFKQIAVINNSILQGKQQLALLAKVNVISAIFGLFLSIPLYYFFKIDGLLYSFILTYLSEAIISKSFVKNVRFNNNVPLTFTKYKNVLKEGFLVGYGNVLTLFAQFIVIYYITYVGGNEQAGLYNAGFSIINNYVALLFIAMSTGYLPRLVKLLTTPIQLQEEITKQLNFSIIIIGCLSLFCILFSNYIVEILFSEDFKEVAIFLRIAVFGMIFKAFSWCLGYLIIAKVDTKVLTFTGVFYNVLYAVMLVFGYEILGLRGIGYAFVLYNFVHLLGIWLITTYKYSLLISNKTIFLLLGMLLLNILLLLL